MFHQVILRKFTFPLGYPSENSIQTHREEVKLKFNDRKQEKFGEYWISVGFHQRKIGKPAMGKKNSALQDYKKEWGNCNVSSRHAKYNNCLHKFKNSGIFQMLHKWR